MEELESQLLPVLILINMRITLIIMVFEGIESFLTELRINLDIKSEKEQDAFIEILFKLGNLEGKKTFSFRWHKRYR